MNPQGELGPLDLPLPVVNVRHPRVFYDNQTCNANGAARAVPDADWRRLESLLLPGTAIPGIAAFLLLLSMSRDTPLIRPHHKCMAVISVGD